MLAGRRSLLPGTVGLAAEDGAIAPALCRNRYRTSAVYGKQAYINFTSATIIIIWPCSRGFLAALHNVTWTSGQYRRSDSTRRIGLVLGQNSITTTSYWQDRSQAHTTATGCVPLDSNLLRGTYVGQRSTMEEWTLPEDTSSLSEQA